MLDLSHVVAHLASCCRVLNAQVGALALDSHKAHLLSLLGYQPLPCLLYCCVRKQGRRHLLNLSSRLVSHLFSLSFCCVLNAELSALALAPPLPPPRGLSFLPLLLSCAECAGGCAGAAGDGGLGHLCVCAGQASRPAVNMPGEKRKEEKEEIESSAVSVSQGRRRVAGESVPLTSPLSTPLHPIGFFAAQLQTQRQTAKLIIKFRHSRHILVLPPRTCSILLPFLSAFLVPWIFTIALFKPSCYCCCNCVFGRVQGRSPCCCSCLSNQEEP